MPQRCIGVRIKHRHIGQTSSLQTIQSENILSSLISEFWYISQSSDSCINQAHMSETIHLTYPIKKHFQEHISLDFADFEPSNPYTSNITIYTKVLENNKITLIDPSISSVDIANKKSQIVAEKGRRYNLDWKSTATISIAIYMYVILGVVLLSLIAYIRNAMLARRQLSTAEAIAAAAMTAATLPSTSEALCEPIDLEEVVQLHALVFYVSLL